MTLYVLKASWDISLQVFLFFYLFFMHPIHQVPSQVLSLLHFYLLTIKRNNISINKNKLLFSYGTILFCTKSDHLDLCRKPTLNKQYNRKFQGRQIFTLFCTLCLFLFLASTAWEWSMAPWTILLTSSLPGIEDNMQDRNWIFYEKQDKIFKQGNCLSPYFVHP